MGLHSPLITFTHNYPQPMAAVFKTGAPKHMAGGLDPTGCRGSEGLPAPNSCGGLTGGTSPALAHAPQTLM